MSRKQFRYLHFSQKAEKHFQSLLKMKLAELPIEVDAQLAGFFSGEISYGKCGESDTARMWFSDVECSHPDGLRILEEILDILPEDSYYYAKKDEGEPLQERGSFKTPGRTEDPK